MILMICWPGWMLWMTSWPIDLALTRSMKSRATLKFTSASSKRQPHFPQGVGDVGLGDFAQAPQVLESVLELAA